MSMIQLLVSTPHTILYPFLWLIIGVVIMGVVGLLWYLHQETKKGINTDVAIVVRPMEPELKQEFNEHKKAVNELSQIIEEIKNGQSTHRTHS
jgi:hypothetical protein